MTNRTHLDTSRHPYRSRAAARIATVLCAIIVFSLQAFAQTVTPGGTTISNRASATYSDGTTDYETVSNTVTVTVANVSGLAISNAQTFRAGSLITNVAAGEQDIDFIFTVTNTGNFPAQVRFPASGGAIGNINEATLEAAAIDVNNNNIIDAGDTDLLTSSDVLSALVQPQGETLLAGEINQLKVIVRVNVSASAAANANVTVRLGDETTGAPTYDNQPADLTQTEVRTASASTPVNGESEGRGDGQITVNNDAMLLLTLNAPAGPVALEANIPYSYSLENNGAFAATAQTLAGAPAGSNTGVFVIAPIPVNTEFVSITPPAGVTVLYSTSALSNDPFSALTVWTTTAPAANTITRVAFNVGNTLAAGATVSNLNLVVKVLATANASNPIYAIGDAFALNSIGSAITDQSGDTVENKGDGNANFNEPRRGVPPAADEAASPTQGYQQPTTLVAVGGVYIGPVNAPQANGPTNQNDDYTNLSVNTGIANIAPTGTTDAPGSVTFTNTVENTGNADDTVNITALAAAGFVVSVSETGAAGTFVTIPNNNTGGFPLALNRGQSKTIYVSVTAPAGQAVLTGYDVVLTATPGNSGGAANQTIDRLYTGFLQLTKTSSIINETGVGNGPAQAGADDPVPGADIEYTITYRNISVGGGDATNGTLTARNIRIVEDGDDGTNTWGATTDEVATPAASDSLGGTIVYDAAGFRYTDTIYSAVGSPGLAPQEQGAFVFRRKIKGLAPQN